MSACLCYRYNLRESHGVIVEVDKRHVAVFIGCSGILRGLDMCLFVCALEKVQSEVLNEYIESHALTRMETNTRNNHITGMTPHHVHYRAIK